MNIKNLFWFPIIFVVINFSHSNVHAAVINKYNFSYDTVSNVIEGNGLYWKRWNESTGLSIDSALSQFSVDGWRVATSREMISMYNVFIPAFNWGIVVDENSGRGETISVADYQNLVSIFGSSLDAFGGISNVLFGSDLDADGFYRVAYAQFSDYEPIAGIGADDPRYESSFANSDYSVQLVKEVSVPAPSNICLMVIFFILGNSIVLRKKNQT